MAQNQPENPQDTPLSADLPKPEFERVLEKTWRDIHKLTPGQKISSEQRKKLFKVLSPEKVQALPKKPKDFEIRNITRQMIETRKGLFPFTKQEEPKGIFSSFQSKGLKRQIKTKIEYTNPSFWKEYKQLQELVADPDSKEAQVIIWLFDQIPPADRPDASEAFDSVSEKDAHDTNVLAEVQESYKKLLADSDNKNIGSTTIVNSRLGKLEADINNCNTNIATANKQTLQYFTDRLEKKTEEKQKFEEKKTELIKALENIDTKLTSLKNWSCSLATSPTTKLTEIQALAEAFTKDNFFNAGTMKGAPLKLGRTTKSVDNWIKDSDAQLKSTQKNFQSRQQNFGYGKPASSAVLDSLIAKHFGKELVGRTSEQHEAFYSEMKKMFLSEEGISSGETDTASTSSGPMNGDSSASVSPSSESLVERGGTAPKKGRMRRITQAIATSPFRATAALAKYSFRATRALVKLPFQMTEAAVKMPFKAAAKTGRGVKSFWEFWTKPRP